MNAPYQPQIPVQYQQPQQMQAAAVPGSMQQFQLSGALSALVDADPTAAAFGTNSPPRVSIRGRVFRLIDGGNEIAVNPSPSMDFIIISASNKPGKTWYANQYVEGSNASPDCWSVDGYRPDPQAKTPQAHACATCPQAVRGTSANGQGAACRFHQNIVVAVPGQLDKWFTMRIPATSLFGDENGHMGLQAYARWLNVKRATVAMVVTSFYWDYNQTQPALRFRVVRELTPAEYQQVQALQKDPEVMRVLSQDLFDNDVTTAVAQQAAQLAAPVQQAPVQYQQPVFQQPTMTQVQYQQPVFQQPTMTQQQAFGQQTQAVQQQQPQPVQEQPVQQGARRGRKPAAQVQQQPQPVQEQPVFQQPIQQYQQPMQQPIAEPVVVQHGSNSTPAMDVASIIGEWGNPDD